MTAATQDTAGCSALAGDMTELLAGRRKAADLAAVNDAVKAEPSE